MLTYEKLIYATAFVTALQRPAKEGRTQLGLNALSEAANAVSAFRYAMQDMKNYDIIADSVKNMALAFVAPTK